MTKTEQLRAEVGELREAVLQLAHIAAQTRLHLFNLPKGGDISSDKLFYSLVRVSSELGSIAYNTPNIMGSDWLQALEKRSGMAFDERQKKIFEQVAIENEQRNKRRKAAA